MDRANVEYFKKIKTFINGVERELYLRVKVFLKTFCLMFELERESKHKAILKNLFCLLQSKTSM